MTEKQIKRIKITFLILSVLAAAKMLVWGYGLDEEYQILMSYRNLKGDTMLGTMWEPHQTSAFLCTAFMWIYQMFRPDFCGVVIWLRICGTCLHFLVSIYLYRVLKDVEIPHAFFLAVLYFNMIPKQIILPEFAIMQTWFFTLLVLFLVKYYGTKRVRYLILTGLAMSLEVLSYPSMIVLCVPLLILVFRVFPSRHWRDCGIISATGALCGIAYTCYFVCRDGGAV